MRARMTPSFARAFALASLLCAALARADDAAIERDAPDATRVVWPLPIECPSGSASTEAIIPAPHDRDGPFARLETPLTTVGCFDGKGRRKGPLFGFYASGERAFEREGAEDKKGQEGLESLRTFHPNGALAAEGMVRATTAARSTTPSGRWKYFSPDGHLERQGATKKGIPVGRWTTFHPNGAKATDGTYDARGFRTGIWTAWYPSGALYWTMNVRITGSGVNLRDRSSGTVYAWDGTVLFQFKEGSLVCRGDLQDQSLALGMEDGVTLASFCSPRPPALPISATRAPLLVLHDGFEHVRAVERVARPGVRTRWAWHDNGQPRAVFSLVDGREQGVARGWDRSGERQIELTYEAGTPSGNPVCSDQTGAKVACDEELLAALK